MSAIGMQADIKKRNENTEKKVFPRILIVSHNVFAKNGPMGKTLETYFSGWDTDSIAQLYFHSEVPTDHICEKYYRFTDIDAIKSIVHRGHHGTSMTQSDIQDERIESTDTGAFTSTYNYGRKRTPLIYLMRDCLWNISAWRSTSLLKWIEDFNPELIFFASGDYAFSYRIVNYLSNQFNKPLIICCFDDYYLYNKNENKVLGRLRQKLFMKEVKKSIDKATCVLTVNEKMSEAYSRIFSKYCPIIFTATSICPDVDCNKEGIAYIGGLGLDRDKQLIDIARTLAEINNDLIPKYIDVYSGETDPQILNRIKHENGIRYHGSVPAEKVADIIYSHKAVIHTESFDPLIRKRVKYSLSTKIPDSLASGTCLLAYGPEEVASIEYLEKYEAAFVATSSHELKDVLIRLFTDENECKRIINNAISLARKNHDNKRIPIKIWSIIKCAIDGECYNDCYGEYYET